MPRLDEWELRPSGIPVLGGIVTGHPREDLPDGLRVYTSTVVMLDVANRKAITRNTEYDLGEPSAAYVEFLARFGMKIEHQGFDNRPSEMREAK